MVVLILAVYQLLLLVVLVGGAPYWIARIIFERRYRAGLRRRLGWVPRRVGLVDARREVVWLHAVSVGEVLAAVELVRALTDAGCLVAISTTTQSGQELARKRFKHCVVFYMPLDVAWIVRRYLRALRPRLVVMMESELWPNLIHACKLAGVPLAVANARVSDRSFPRYMRLRRVWKPLLREVSLFIAQSEQTARRLEQIGVLNDQIIIAGNVKYDGREPRKSPLTLAVQALAPARLVIAGSTLQGEEEIVLKAFAELRKTLPDTSLLIAPRHQQRFQEVASLIQQSGFPCLPCSRINQETPPVAPGTVLLLDTIGDLASMYSLAAAAFVGGSLVEKGGHNPLEAARFGVPVVMGPSYENFREIVDLLREAEAIWIVKPDELTSALLSLLQHVDESRAIGQRARQLFEAQAGATQRTVAPLLGLLRRFD